MLIGFDVMERFKRLALHACQRDRERERERERKKRKRRGEGNIGRHRVGAGEWGVFSLAGRLLF